MRAVRYYTMDSIPWMVKELDRKLIVICDIFSVLTRVKPNCKLSVSPNPQNLHV